MTFAPVHPWRIDDHCPSGPDGRCELTASPPFPDPTGKVGPMIIQRCRHCGVGVTRPPIPDVAFLYESRESRDFQPDTAGVSRLLKRIAFGLQARRVLRQLGNRPRRVIDFGCGSGLFTAALAGALTPGAEVVATDFHPDPPPELAGIAYRPISAPDALAGADALIATHVLEHDDDPLKLLQTMTALVRPGGRLLIEVPNIDCVWAKLCGRGWDGWYLPYHRVHFSRAALRALLERGGLGVVSEHAVAVPSLGRTAAQMLGRRNGTAFVLLTALLYPLQILVERATGRPTALRVVAEKL